MKRTCYLPIIFWLAIMLGHDSSGLAQALAYPPTRVDNVVDTLWGVPVPDPYRWLEPSDDPEVQQWTDAQNELTRKLLDAQSCREKIVERIRQLWNYARFSAPSKFGQRYFYTENDGLQNQPILYTAQGNNGKPQVLIDPNGLSADGTKAMDWYYVSDDGAMIAYGVSSSGSEDATLHVKDVATGTELPFQIKRCKYASVAWEKDDSGFYYTRYPDYGSVPAGEENYNEKVFYHRIGTEVSADSLIYERPDHKDYGISLETSLDQKYLIFEVYEGTGQTNELYYMDLARRDGIHPLVTGFKSYYAPIIVNGKIYVMTKENAPNFKVMVGEMSNPGHDNWKELVPESTDALQSIQYINNTLVLHYLHNACSSVRLFDLNGKPIRELNLPTLGTVNAITGRWNEPEMFLSFSSFAYAPAVLRYDFSAQSPTVYRKSEVKIDAADYETHQVWYPSKDGTKISMFIINRKGLQLDGNNPTLLYGYGGFSVNSTPFFSSSITIWLDHGGVYAYPNLRGGNEYGEKWHEGGMLANKQNVFDDFIAAAEWLIANKYTNKDKLAVEGGSNGGLLTGAVMVQRPELFKAVVCEVPLLDMLRYQNFLIARFWIPEYGSSEDSSQFKYLLAYSPYHNVKPNTRYPAALIKAGESDGRVHPMHARKFAARMQAANVSDNPILLWVERKAGHGQGKPISMQIDDVADNWTFLFWQLGITY